MPLPLADRRIADWLFLVTLAAYAYFFAGGGWNQNSQLDLTRAIVEKHSFAIDAYAANTGDVSYHEGHVYSNKSPGLSWMAVIPYLALNALERFYGQDVSSAAVVTLNAYLLTVFCVALTGAMIPPLLYRFARRRRFGAAWSATVALAVGLGTQLMPYASLLMLHVPSAMFLLLALDASSATPGRGPRPLIAGMAAGAATVTNYLCAPMLFLSAVLLAFRSEDRQRDLARFGAGAMPSLVLLAIYQKVCFGGFLTNSMTRTDARFVSKQAWLGVITGPSAGAAFGITFSSYRGFFYFAPVLLFALAGMVLWWRGRRERAELLVILTISAVFFLFNLTFNGWDGGFGIGARYLVPLIPLWGVAMLYCRSWLRHFLAVVAVLSMMINLAAVAVDPQPSGTIPSPMKQYIVPLLLTGRFSPRVPITPPWSAQTFTGHTSVNRVTMNEPVPFLLYAPYSREAEWASFNLGEIVFGAGELLSVVPLLLAVLTAVTMILRRCRAIDLSA